MSEREAILRDIDDFFEGNIIETEEPVVEQEEVFQPVPSNPLEQVERVQAIASPPTPDDANSFSQFTPFITRIIAGTSLLDEAKFDPAKKSQILALVDEILTMEQAKRRTTQSVVLFGTQIRTHQLGKITECHLTQSRGSQMKFLSLNTEML